MKEKLSVVWAFMRRDAISWASYRSEAAYWFLRYAVMGLTWAVFAYMVEFRASEMVAKYGADVTYLAYFMINMGFNRVIFLAWMAPAHFLYAWNLEWLLLSPVSIWDAVIGSSLFHYLLEVGEFTMYMCWAVYLGAFYQVNLISAILVLVMGILCMWGYGLLSASVMIIVKRGDPISSLFASFGELFSGTFFPIEALPIWLQQVSFFVPQYYILEMMRQTTLGGHSILELGDLALGFFVFTLVFLTLGAILFKQAVAFAKVHGTVGFF